ncbi:hypothetical protein [Methylotenera versatilis]|uniref:Uncharacterized protein n=1 Tax=Methylotenera versatilis (strain 301) TaxID=666681 RepID=D7DHK7_METV0|nr:hypothetical protein [Methylotenera versatilis]ADI29542.1 hypothetical protein M301_1158 [Methylotenera versatilis 301]
MDSHLFSTEEQLALLKKDYLEAYAAFKSNHSPETLDRLDVAKDAYLLKLNPMVIISNGDS